MRYLFHTRTDLDARIQTIQGTELETVLFVLTKMSAVSIYMSTVYLSALTVFKCYNANR